MIVEFDDRVENNTTTTTTMRWRGKIAYLLSGKSHERNKIYVCLARIITNLQSAVIPIFAYDIEMTFSEIVHLMPMVFLLFNLSTIIGGYISNQIGTNSKGKEKLFIFSSFILFGGFLLGFISGNVNNHEDNLKVVAIIALCLSQITFGCSSSILSCVDYAFLNFNDPQGKLSPKMTSILQSMSILGNILSHMLCIGMIYFFDLKWYQMYGIFCVVSLLYLVTSIFFYSINLNRFLVKKVSGDKYHYDDDYDYDDGGGDVDDEEYVLDDSQRKISQFMVKQQDQNDDGALGLIWELFESSIYRSYVLSIVFFLTFVNTLTFWGPNILSNVVLFEESKVVIARIGITTIVMGIISYVFYAMTIDRKIEFLKNLSIKNIIFQYYVGKWTKYDQNYKRKNSLQNLKDIRFQADVNKKNLLINKIIMIFISLIAISGIFLVISIQSNLFFPRFSHDIVVGTTKQYPWLFYMSFAVFQFSLIYISTPYSKFQVDLFPRNIIQKYTESAIIRANSYVNILVHLCGDIPFSFIIDHIKNEFGYIQCVYVLILIFICFIFWSWMLSREIYHAENNGGKIWKKLLVSVFLSIGPILALTCLLVDISHFLVNHYHHHHQQQQSILVSGENIIYSSIVEYITNNDNSSSYVSPFVLPGINIIFQQ